MALIPTLTPTPRKLNKQVGKLCWSYRRILMSSEFPFFGGRSLLGYLIIYKLRCQGFSIHSFSSGKMMLTLRSSDGEIFEVEEEVARVSKLIEGMIVQGCADTVIPIGCIHGKILGKVLEYCKEQASVNGKETDQKESEEWGKRFIDVDFQTLVDLLMASDFLIIQGILDLGIEKMVSIIRGKYPQEIRDMFNIVNDFTLEEEMELRRANPWAFEGEPNFDAGEDGTAADKSD